MLLPHGFSKFKRLLFPVLLIATFQTLSAKPGFTELQFNPHWYRTFDSTSDIIPDKGQLLFNWKFADAEKHPDSFYVGIDTLWALPQDIDGDTNQDWDLEVCPNGFCMNGLKAGVHGADAPDPFVDTTFATEHHFQFFPAVSPQTFRFTGPHGGLFGALMYCRSRSTGQADTVFAFGTWGISWDSLNLPPVRPVSGYLPKLADFSISGNTVKYLQAGANLRPAGHGSAELLTDWKVESDFGVVRFDLPKTGSDKKIRVYTVDGKPYWDSGLIPGEQTALMWKPRAARLENHGTMLLIRFTWKGRDRWQKVYLPK